MLKCKKKQKKPVVLNAVSMITTIRLMENDWMVFRFYEKNGKKIRVVGFGRTRPEAIHNLNFEVWQEAEYL